MVVAHQTNWKLVSEIEAGRAEVLKKVASGEPLSDILNTLCKNSEIYNPEMKTSVLRLNNETNTLHPCASVSLPGEYCQALEGVVIGTGVGSCGTAAFKKERVIVEDINTHPYWAQYKELALSAGLQSCWSEPIIGQNNHCYGTFAIYYDKPSTPTENDLKFIQTCAHLAAIVFENNVAKQKLLEANHKLSQTIDERTHSLEIANKELELLLASQKQDSLLHTHSEKSNTTRLLLMGFAHQLNTPLGIATTSSTHISDVVNKIHTLVDINKITKVELLNHLEQIKKGLSLNQQNLYKASDLITKFREVGLSFTQEEKSSFTLQTFFNELFSFYQQDNPSIEFKLETDANIRMHSKIALWQIFAKLIENSLEHGFRQSGIGSISIYITELENNLEINYQDDGIGINKQYHKDIFEPFFTTRRQAGNLGLGLNVVTNILSNVYHGRIQLEPAPCGTRYTVFISKY